MIQIKVISQSKKLYISKNKGKKEREKKYLTR